jgi:hypothetical protein
MVSMNFTLRLLVAALVFAAIHGIGKFACAAERQPSASRARAEAADASQAGTDKSEDDYEKQVEQKAWNPTGDEPAEGILTAHLPESSLLGEPLTLMLSFKNVDEEPAFFGYSLRFLPSRVWMRDEAGKSVPRRLGRAISASEMLRATLGNVEPGWAYGCQIPLEKSFDLSRPGRYKVVARYGHFSYSNPLTVDIRPPSRETPGNARPADAEASISGQSFGEGAAFAQQWEAAKSVAGGAVEGVALETVISPEVHTVPVLVVSMTNVGATTASVARWLRPEQGGYAGLHGTKAPFGIRAADCYFLLHDAAGNPVTLTPGGRAYLKKQWPPGGPSNSLRPGDAVGFAIRLDKLFQLEPGKEYAALVVLPGNAASDPALVSSPVKVAVPKLGTPGVDRPPLGSDRMWERLLRALRTGRSDLTMKTTISFSPTGRVFADVEARVPTKLGQPIVNIYQSGVLLIRDRHGAFVDTKKEGGCSSCLGWWVSGSAVVGSQGEESRFSTKQMNLCRAYHFIPGEPYTLLAAIGLQRREHDNDDALADSLWVARPVTFVAPEEYSGSRPESPPVQEFPPRPTLSAEQQWTLASRFAGKPFRGVVLEAASPKSGQLLLTLRNITNWGITIRRWSERSDYEVLVRDARGRFVQLRVKGKAFFQVGKALLEESGLGRRDTLKESLPIGELFDMSAPGEYTVLVSLPVIDDTIDAVLTAAPVKIRIDAPKAQPQPKK